MQTEEPLTHDYAKYRGKCRELCDQAIAEDPTLKLVRGHYHCPMWGPQAHWWTVRPDGSIHDPAVQQFPTCGFAAEYVEFDGAVECSQCGKKGKEEEFSFESNYRFCSTACHMRFVGL